MKKERTKKPFYKKIWVWAIIIIVVIVAANIGGGDDSKESTATKETTKATTQEIKKESSPSKNKTPKKKLPYPETAVQTTLGAGTFSIGDDIKEGRYTIHTNESSGNISSGMGLNEILGADSSIAVNDVVTTFKDGEELQIQGLNNVTFTPKVASTLPDKPTLTKFNSGTYYVGVDILEGKYIVSTNDTSGNFNVGLNVNEILGTDASLATNNIQVNLKDGDEIQLAGLNNTTFTPK
ncbi:hypothetical protein HCB26_14600 [Listeria booriae]|uniref:Uncharacterized protein n=1 Tax=Listeria booriae TaxID=1552123 RepID=A0A7X0Z209_9LIST|nr:hypothetical protein [Listeria booriae]MBC2167804.1 hypothetical protein [Listeria booriae]MBC2189784.1 hypothetical protein [Listeria booriae]